MNTIDVLDDTVLREVHSINLRGLQLLQNPSNSGVGTAASRPGAGPTGTLAGSGPLPGSPRELALWRSIDPAGMVRLAQQPFLLFDIGLDDPLRWHAARTPAVGDDPVAIAGPFSGWTAAQFAGTLFHYSWFLARTAPLTAAIVAGMASATAEVLRGLSLQQVDELAQRSPHWLRLRWEDSPALWTELLRVARSSADAPQQRTAPLRILQRLAGIALTRRLSSAPAVQSGSGQRRGSL